MKSLHSEIKMLKSLLKIEESKNIEWAEHTTQLTEYAEGLESKLADSEVLQESTLEEVDKTKRLLEQSTAENASLRKENATLQEELVNLNQDMLRSIDTAKEQQQRAIEEMKYALFKSLMDSFQMERKALEQKYVHTQGLLAQATKVSVLCCLLLAVCAVCSCCCWLFVERTTPSK